MNQKHRGEETDFWVGPSEMVSKSFPQKATIKLDKTDKTIKGSKKWTKRYYSLRYVYAWKLLNFGVSIVDTWGLPARTASVSSSPLGEEALPVLARPWGLGRCSSQRGLDWAGVVGNAHVQRHCYRRDDSLSFQEILQEPLQTESKWHQITIWMHRRKWKVLKRVNVWVNIKDSIYFPHFFSWCL